MANITAAMVKELRDKTDAGMMDCKKALTETNGDMEAAVEYLRKTGAAKAEKRADKATKEGKVFAAVDGNKAVMIEVLCETDFVAGNEKFFDYVKEAAGRVLAGTSGDGDITEKAQELENNNLKELFVKFGEKMVLRRAIRFESAGVVASYMHGNGKIGIMIDVEGTNDPELLKAICMHIAAYSPLYVTPAEPAVCHARRSSRRSNREGEGDCRRAACRQARQHDREDPRRQDQQVVYRNLPHEPALDP